MEELIAEWERRAAEINRRYPIMPLPERMALGAEAETYLLCAMALRNRLAASMPTADAAAVVVVVHEPAFAAEDGLRGQWDRPFDAGEFRDNLRKLAQPVPMYGVDDWQEGESQADWMRRTSGRGKPVSGYYGEWYDEPVTRCCNLPESKCRCSTEVFNAANRRQTAPAPEDAPAEPFSERGI